MGRVNSWLIPGACRHISELHLKGKSFPIQRRRKSALFALGNPHIPVPMRLEHLFFNLAVAIVCGIAYQRMSGRDPSVIIVLVAFLPDIDVLVHTWMHVMAWLFGTSLLIYHGSFHNLPALAAISLLVAILASCYGIRFRDAGLCTAIGYGTHLACDAVAFNEVPYLLWPLGPVRTGPVPYWYHPDLFGIAQGSVLAIAILLFLIAALVRTRVEGPSWIQRYTYPRFT